MTVLRSTLLFGLSLSLGGLLFVPNETLRADTDTEHETVKFLVYGDMPYSVEKSEYGRARPFETKLLENVFPVMVDREGEGHEFVMHVGDLKAGGSRCSEREISQNLLSIANVFPGRSLYTPGDNDWTDCDRGGDSELDKLQSLREKLYLVAPDEAFTEEARFISQEGLEENQMWQVRDVVFASMHITGTNNGRDEILHDKTERALSEVAVRDRKNSEWLSMAFEKAEAQSAKAIVLFFHADILVPLMERHEYAGTPCRADNPVNCDGFADFRNLLANYSNRYPDRSVLFVHGDTNQLCLEKAYGVDRKAPLADNLWRLNAPGDFKFMDLAEVTIDTQNKAAPFRANGILYEQPLPTRCEY